MSQQFKPPQITGRQADTLRAVHRYIEEHGFPPSMRDVSAVTGLSQTRSHQLVNVLCRKGYLAREKRTARSVVLTRLGDAYLWNERNGQ